MAVDVVTPPELTADQAAPRTGLRFRAARVLLAVLPVTLVAVVVAGVYDDTANALISAHLGPVAGFFVAGLLAVVALRAPLRRPGAVQEDTSYDEISGEDEGAAVRDPEAIEPKAIAPGARAAARPARRAPSTEVEAVDAAAADAPAPDAVAPDAPADAPADTVISPQALLLQVRSLEATLAEEDQRLGRVRREAAQKAEEQVRREHDRVRHTLRVMRAVVADQPGAAAVARIETALDRLATDGELARPLLSNVAAGSWAVAFAPPVPLAALTSRAVAEPAAADDSAARSAGDSTDGVEDGAGHGGPAGHAGPDADPADAATAPAAPVGPAKVLPVPPPPAPLAASRKGRRARRAVGV